MKKEECIALLDRYANYNGVGIPNLEGCKEAMLKAVELLSRPSLPSNLDEAAEEYAAYNSQRWFEGGDIYYDRSKIMNAFIAGAEWMAAQGESIESTVVTTQDEDTCRPYLALQNFGYMPAPITCKESDEVIVQIRKKQ